MEDLPIRPGEDGWPDWPERRPIPVTERDRLRQTINADRLSRETARAQTDQHPRKRARLTIALRLAAGEDHRTRYEATSHRITLGIAGPDARERTRAPRQEIQRSHRWTITEDIH